MKAIYFDANVRAMKVDMLERHSLRIRLFSMAVVLICCCWFIYAIARQGPQLLSLLQNPGLSILLPLLLIVLQSGMFLTGFSFHILVRAMGQPSKLSEAVWILMLSQLGKYLPGNVGHHLARVGLARTRGYPVATASFAIAVELATSLLVASVIGAGFFLIAPEAMRGSLMPWVPDFSKVSRTALVLGCLLATAGLGVWAVGRLLQKHKLPSARVLGITAVIAAANFVVLGTVLSLVLQVVAPEAPLSFPFIAAAYAYAWILGTVTPGAPGGIGVREAILVLLLAPYCGESPALAAAIYLRLATSLADLLSFMLGLAWRHFALRVASQQTQDGV